jgi:hypothetical protein
MRVFEVGQSIRISCGQFNCWVTVFKVTADGVEVQNDSGGLLRFDSEGKGYYMEETCDCPGPWYIERDSSRSRSTT